jgi:hypothetical protein
MTSAPRLISSDNFVRVLSLRQLAPLMRDSGQRKRVFQLLTEYSRQKSYVEDRRVASEQEIINSGGLSARVPGTSIFVRLTKPTTDDIKSFTEAALYATVGLGKLDLSTLTVAAVISLRDRIRKARVDRGERSVVDVILEASTSISSSEVHARLYNLPCKHEGSGCSYETTDQLCSLTMSSLEAILESLEAKQVIEGDLATSPRKYSAVT